MKLVRLPLGTTSDTCIDAKDGSSQKKKTDEERGSRSLTGPSKSLSINIKTIDFEGSFRMQYLGEAYSWLPTHAVYTKMVLSDAYVFPFPVKSAACTLEI